MTKTAIRGLPFVLIPVLAGCMSAREAPRMVQPAPVAAQPAKMITAEAGGTYVLPDGTRVLRDGAGGFTLPNGEYVRRAATGDLVLPNGNVCRASGPNFLCP
ncbi:MAG: hypothetical protein O9972_62615 [Burkholderiales bacterium]|nr:hypothetical protein [Burkholderiales bacterium]